MMKKIVVAFVLVVVLISCRKSLNGFPEMDFNETTYNFGTIKAGEKVEKDFVFTNSGKQDLIISGVQGSCGCTVGEYPKQPVKPNAKGIIKVRFNSEGKHGKQEKSVTISSNTEDRISILKIFADVKTLNNKQ